MFWPFKQPERHPRALREGKLFKGGRNDGPPTTPRPKTPVPGQGPRTNVDAKALEDLRERLTAVEAKVAELARRNVSP